MSKTFTILTRAKMRSLKPKQKLQEHGIIYTKLSNNDGKFSICITVDHQRIHRVVGNESEGTTREQAEEYISKLKIEAKENRLNLPKARKTFPNFKEIALRYLNKLKLHGDKDLKKKEARLKLHIIPFFALIPLYKITTSEIEEYKQKRLKDPLKTHLNKLTSEATINRELAIISHIFNKSLEWGWLDKLPCKIKKFNEDSNRIVYLTTNQIQRVLKKAKEDLSPHIYLYILIALNTAMRSMEILSIQKKDIDLERKIISIPKAKAGAREQPIPESLVKHLKKRIYSLKADSYLFPSPKSCTGHLKDIRKPFQRIMKLAGLDPKQVVRHTLRHTAITHLVQAGVDLPTVQRISGHKTLSMVGRYSHQNGNHIQEAFERLEGRFKV